MCLLCIYHECMWGLWSHLGIPAWGTPSATSGCIGHCWEVLQPCSVYQTCAGPAPFSVAMCWDSHAPGHTLECHPKSMVHLWLCWWHRGGGGWGFQGNMFLAMRGSTCEWHCLHAFQAWLWTSWRLGGILFWRVFILFLFVFNLGSIIIYSKHSEASSRAILELQLGLSLPHALVHLYRVNWRSKMIKYSICLRCCFSFIFF